MPGVGTDDRVLGALATAIDRLEAAWLPAELSAHPEFHDYQSTPVDTFMQGLAVCREHAPGGRWLEVGCGIGTKLILAHEMGFRVHGLDNRAQYIAAAKFLCPEATLEVADARYYDRYGAFDVVFCYRPLIKEEATVALERWIVSRMAAGALLYLPYRNIQSLGWHLVSEHVWRRD